MAQNKGKHYLFRIEDSDKLSYEYVIKELSKKDIIVVEYDWEYIIEIKSFEDFEEITLLTGYPIELMNNCITIMN